VTPRTAIQIRTAFTLILLQLLPSFGYSDDVPLALRVGEACHAFEHLGEMGHQLDAAVDSGATVIYASGVGALGYEGLPAADLLQATCTSEAAYHRRAKEKGIKLVVGYLCATSIVKLETFDKHWTDDFRKQFKTPPSEWLQQDRNGKTLASWYGGNYNPACMNNPDWRVYEHAMVRMQLDVGCDGIFFDNPTVHTKGCYCPHCMEAFAQFLKVEGVAVPDKSAEAVRALSDAHKSEFMRFRTTIARDFFADIRAYARTINLNVLITANNSLNAPSVFYTQSVNYGYNIFEMSKAEDFIVLEDMSTQPRITADGKVIEYGPVLKLVHAIAHGKPVVDVKIAETDYHTPPNLVKLAFAESAANNASYLVWTTWPGQQRQKLSSATRKQVDLLRANQSLLNGGKPRRDVTLFLPFRRWQESKDCRALEIAYELTKSNIQYDVFCEEDFNLDRLVGAKILIVESMNVLLKSEVKVVESFQTNGGRVIAADSPNWTDEARNAIGTPSVTVVGPKTVRAYVTDFPDKTVVHLLNLNIERVNSFEDKVTPADNLQVLIEAPSPQVRSMNVFTADEVPAANSAKFEPKPHGEWTTVEVALPRLEVAAIVTLSSEVRK
jgi:hypothetical protein